jgi:hypothetical protein
VSALDELGDTVRNGAAGGQEKTVATFGLTTPLPGALRAERRGRRAILPDVDDRRLRPSVARNIIDRIAMSSIGRKYPMITHRLASVPPHSLDAAERS